MCPPRQSRQQLVSAQLCAHKIAQVQPYLRESSQGNKALRHLTQTKAYPQQFTLNEINDQSQVFHFLYAIWPKSKDLYPTYLKATQPPSDLRNHQVSIKFTRLAYMFTLFTSFTTLPNLTSPHLI